MNADIFNSMALGARHMSAESKKDRSSVGASIVEQAEINYYNTGCHLNTGER